MSDLEHINQTLKEISKTLKSIAFALDFFVKRVEKEDTEHGAGATD